MRHLSTRKHKNLTNPPKKTPKNSNDIKHICRCGKIYKHRQSLNFHIKTCSYDENNDVKDKTDKDKIMELTEQVCLLSERLLELKNNSSHTTNIQNSVLNNSNNKTENNHVSINVFLNEQCKDAINFEDFINQI